MLSICVFHGSMTLAMEEDLRIVLKENARLLEELTKSGANASEDPNVIPVIIKYGAFSPKRLDKWDYVRLQELALKDEAFMNTIWTSLLALASKDLQTTITTLNEKKAVSVLLAGKDKAAQLVDALLKKAAIAAPRFFFIAREYVQAESDWLRCDFTFILPFPQIKAFSPKFCEKYPQCAEFITHPSPEPIRQLLSDPSRTSEIAFIASLAARHYRENEEWIYENLLEPVWSSKDPLLAKTVLEVLVEHPSFAEFCTDKLNKQ